MHDEAPGGTWLLEEPCFLRTTILVGAIQGGKAGRAAVKDLAVLCVAIDVLDFEKAICRHACGWRGGREERAVSAVRYGAECSGRGRR